MTEVRLRFDRAGTGLAMLLVHGLGCDRSLMRPLLTHFSRSYDVVSVDLRGHGESRRVGPYGVEVFLHDLQRLIASLELNRPIVVGHSMGGLLCVELAASSACPVAAAVALDTMFFPRELETWRPELAPLLGRLSRIDDEDRQAWFRTMHTGPFDDAATSERIFDVLQATPLEVTAAASKGIRGWDCRRALVAARAPVFAVAAEAGSPYDASRLVREFPHLFCAVTVGSGHFVQLMATAQVTGMIERFLEIVGSPVAA